MPGTDLEISAPREEDAPLAARSPDSIAPVEQQAPELPDELYRIPVDQLYRAMRQQLRAINSPVTHWFAPGVYAREVLMPAGGLFIGKKHRGAHICIVSAGEITVWGEGKDAEVVMAPHTEVGGPGTQRIGYTHADTVWTAIFPNPDNERDIEILMARYFEPDPVLEESDAPIPRLGMGGDA